MIGMDAQHKKANKSTDVKTGILLALAFAVLAGLFLATWFVANRAGQYLTSRFVPIDEVKMVPLQTDGGTLVVPVTINGSITLKFTVDSGASNVTIPADVVSTLILTGTIQQSDFLGKQVCVLADGSNLSSQTFLIRSLKVGDFLVQNVAGSVVPAAGSLLLGQSFLKKFKSWSVDNARKQLLLQSR